MSPEAQTARGTRPEATLFLHIGVGKTGTTSIQQYFAENRQHLREIGIDYPETGLHPTGGHHILSHKWGGWLDPKDFAQTPDAAWEDLGRHVAHGRHRYLVSSERFCGIAYSEDWRDRLEFIRQSLAGVRVKIVCYIRRTEDLIESAYRQKVKIEGFSDPIDEFVEFCTKEGNEFFDQYELCRRYAAVFLARKT